MEDEPDKYCYKFGALSAVFTFAFYNMQRGVNRIGNDALLLKLCTVSLFSFSLQFGNNNLTFYYLETQGIVLTGPFFIPTIFQSFSYYKLCNLISLIKKVHFHISTFSLHMLVWSIDTRNQNFTYFICAVLLSVEHSHKPLVSVRLRRMLRLHLPPAEPIKPAFHIFCS